MDITPLAMIGSIGTALYICSYLLINTGKLSGDSPRYIVMNMVAALLVLISLSESFNLPSFMIQVFWVGISVFGLSRYYLVSPGAEVTRKAPVNRP